MEIKSFKVSGMHCNGCSLGLEDCLEKIPWIEEAKVELETETATIKYNEKKFNYNKIKDTVERRGFKIVDN